MKHALIVGASSSVGTEIATRLSKNNRLSLLSRDINKLSPSKKSNISVFSADVCDHSAFKQSISEAVEASGRIDYLVYCPGLQVVKPLRSMSSQEISDVVNVNLTGALICASVFASSRISNKDAVFGVISSIAANNPEPGIVSYSAAKAGLSALVKGIARECAPKRAFAVSPGWLDTAMTQNLSHVYNEAFVENLQRLSPLGMVTPSEVADLVVNLLCGSMSKLTGQTIVLDGGYSL
jgi:NAD(P)-dependent dehydrogenase (short-subunit alcohol dehydrogenase family)